MEAVELHNDINWHISDSTFYEEIPKDVSEILKADLQAS